MADKPENESTIEVPKEVSLVDSGRRKSRLSQPDISLLAQSNTSRTKLRRQSFGFHSVPGIRKAERVSTTAIEFKRPLLVYMPTYQLESYNPFNMAEVKKIMDETVDELFDKRSTYKASTSPTLPMIIASELVKRIKSMSYNRYRIIAVVSLAQKRAQSYNNTISFIWDSDRDSYVDIHREYTTAFLQATVFGVYLD